MDSLHAPSLLRLLLPGGRSAPSPRLAAAVLAAGLLLMAGAVPVSGAVIVSQPASGGLMPFQSSQLGYDWQGNDYDQYIWDDFTLASPASIVEVQWRGVYTSGGYWGGPVIDFVVAIWASNPMVDAEPNVLGLPLVEYFVGGNANENPLQPSGAIAQSFHDYSFVLPHPFAASAGTHYWLQVEAIQAGPTDWGIVAGSGNGGAFGSHVNYAGGFQYWHLNSDAAFTLLDAPSMFCGNAVVESGESCDDGAANGTVASCCTRGCAFETASTPCSGGTCDGAGACIPTPTTTTTTTLPPVTGCSPAPLAGCLGGRKASMALHVNSKPEGNRIKWKLSSGDAFTLGTVGDPMAPPVYRLCLYDEVAGVPALVASLTVAHASAWQVVGTTGLRYHDPAGVSDGVQTLNFKPGADGSAQVNLSALGAAIPMPMAHSATQFFAGDTQVVAQLINDSTSACWSTAFPTAHRNDGEHYMAQQKTP